MDFKTASEAHNKLVSQMNKYSQSLNQISKLEDLFESLDETSEKKVREAFSIMRKYILTEQEILLKEIAKSPIWEFSDN